MLCCILIGILRVPNVVRSSKFASLQNILRLTEANKQVKRDEVASKATGAISGTILSLCLVPYGQTSPPALSSSFPSMLCMPPLCPQLPTFFSLKLFPLPFLLKLSAHITLKMKTSGDPKPKPLISHTSWTTAEL